MGKVRSVFKMAAKNGCNRINEKTVLASATAVSHCLTDNGRHGTKIGALIETDGTQLAL